MATAASQVVSPPVTPRHSRATARIVKRDANGDPTKKLPFVGSPSARSMTFCDQPQNVSHSPPRALAKIAANDSPTVNVGSPIDSISASASDASCDASRDAAVIDVIHHQPRHADGERRLVTGGGAQLAQFSKRSPATPAWTRHAVPHNMVRGAIRIAARSGSSAGSASATWRARSQLSRAAPMSRLVAQAPRACASRRRRADHRRPPDARRSGRRSRRPSPGHVASIAAATRRCSSARSDLS